MNLHELRFCCSRCIRKHGRRLTYEELNGFKRVCPHCAHEEDAAEDLQSHRARHAGTDNGIVQRQIRPKSNRYAAYRRRGRINLPQ